MSREIEDTMRKNANALKHFPKVVILRIKKEVCWLGNVIVSKDFSGKGAANYLLKTMIMKAKSIYKVKHLLLSCHSTNSRGLAFYHKHGFKPINKRITDLDEQKIITIQMKLEI
ncbi:GNAT family N-acetyltransferase [Paenibacillus taichungensis]